MSAAASDVAVELPAPPRPPELRTEAEGHDATQVLAGYGFPAHESLTPLCGWREFAPGQTTWTFDLLTSPVPLARLRVAYERRLGKQGLQDATWSVPATGTLQRQLSLRPIGEVREYVRCQPRPPANARTLVVVRRAR